MEVTQDEGRIGGRRGNPESYMNEGRYWAFGKSQQIRTGWGIAKRLNLKET